MFVLFHKILLKMMDHIYNGIQQPRTSRPWTKPVDVPSEFENLLNHIENR